MLNSQSFTAPEEFLDARRYERGWPFEFVVVSDYVSLIEILVVLESGQFGCYL